MPTYKGACHCGAVRFEIDAEIKALTVCDCSLCRKKNAVMAQVHESAFRLLTAPETVTEYRWNTMTARHFFCPVCGIYTFHKQRSYPEHYGVNVFCLDGLDPDAIARRKGKGAALSTAADRP